MQWPCEFNKRASATCHPEQGRRIPQRHLKAFMAGSLDCARDEGHIVGQAFPVAVLPAGRQECLPYKLDPQPPMAAAATNASPLESKRDRANRKRIGRATPAAPPELHLPES